MTQVPQPSLDAVGGRRPLVKRYAGLVRLAHWLNAVFLLGMIGSGLQIYNAYTHFGDTGRSSTTP